MNYADLLCIGVNCSDGVSRCMGDSELYESVLKIFAQNTGRIAEIRRCFDAKDYDALYGAVHDIKGVAANLSLTPLVEKSSCILTHLKSSEFSTMQAEIESLAVCFSNIAEIVNT